MPAQNKQLTLCILHSAGRVLLGMKKRGFGESKWNGFGGKLEAHESIIDAARREMLEESGVAVLDVSYRGHIIFEFAGVEQLLEVHVFYATQYSGVPTESEEMRPQWFDESDVPFQDMWADDIVWLPRLLQGECFEAYFLFRGQQHIEKHVFTRVDGFAATVADARPVTETQGPIDVPL